MSGEKTGWVYNYLGASLQQQAFDSKLCNKKELGTALDIVILIAATEEMTDFDKICMCSFSPNTRRWMQSLIRSSILYQSKLKCGTSEYMGDHTA